MKSTRSFQRWEEVRERASERTNERSARAKRVVRSKRMSERCKGAEDRMAQYSTRRFHMISTLCATSLHHELELNSGEKKVELSAIA